MKTLEDVRQQLAGGEFEFSRHAFRRVVERNISEQEIREAGAQAESIEDYPEDKYSPSALLLGCTAAGHVPCTSKYRCIVCGNRVDENHHHVRAEPT